MIARTRVVAMCTVPAATRNWVPAIDFWLERDGNTRVLGSSPQPGGATLPFFAASGVARELILAPALEYNWSSEMGIIFGARVVAAGRNETGFVTPVAASATFSNSRDAEQAAQGAAARLRGSASPAPSSRPRAGIPRAAPA